MYDVNHGFWLQVDRHPENNSGPAPGKHCFFDQLLSMDSAQKFSRHHGRISAMMTTGVTPSIVFCLV